MKFNIEGKVFRAKKYKQAPIFQYFSKILLVRITGIDGVDYVSKVVANRRLSSNRVAIQFNKEWYSISDDEIRSRVIVGDISKMWNQVYEKPRKKYFRVPARRALREIYVCSDGGRAKSSIGVRETNDCAVIAIAHILDKDYNFAHSMVKARTGRLPGKGVVGMAKYLNISFSDYFESVPIDKKDKVTVARFSKENTAGRFLILTRGHAQCVIDGKIYDNASFGPLRRILCAFKLKEGHYEPRNTN